MNRLVVWGASGHARVIAEIARLSGEFELVGWIDDVSPDRHGELFCGHRVLGGREQLENLRSSGVEYLVFGFGDCAARLDRVEAVVESGFRFATLCHPQAVIASDASLGAGTVVAAGAVVNPNTAVGRNVIINTCASVDHDCKVGEGVHLSPGARLGGHVSVGAGTWIGMGAVLVDHVMIGSRSVVGAGAVVLQDIPDRVVAYGIPARVRRSCM